MARKIYIYTGNLRWKFSELLRVRTEANRLGHGSSVDWTNWESVVQAKEKRRNDKLDLHEALHRWGHHECQDTHDKVYGLLGLVRKSQITINLTISTTNLLAEVFRLEEKKIYARRYRYADEFAAKLLRSMGLEIDETAKRIKTEFLTKYKE